MIDIAPNDPRSGRPPRAEEHGRDAPDAHRGCEHGLQLRGSPRPQDRHTTQYFEIFGNRSIYHDGWLAGTVHPAGWEFSREVEKYVWELYDTRKDFSLANDLAAKNPGKLKECKILMKEAVKYSVIR